MKSSKSSNGLNRKVQVRTPKDYPWKVLDHLITDLRCCLSDESVEEIRRIVRKRDYPSYLKLSESWGPQSNLLQDDISVSEFYAKYQASALLKKFQFPSDSKVRRDAALEKFKTAEEACKEFNQTGCTLLACLTENDELEVFTHARHFLSKLLGEFLPENSTLTLWSRHGPGSNLDTTQRRISLYDKYKSWPYSCTSGALEYARLAIQSDERWLGALESDYREKYGIEPWRILNQEVFWSNVLNVVPGNRITFVPKNSQIDRSIAIEPCMNLYLQLGVDGYVRRRLLRYGVNLDDQTKNQKLAWEGSKYWRTENPFVTLDLAAASDSISTSVCKLLLPPQWYNYLMALRSPSGECDGETFSYEKISSMGNGYTFALESAIFTSLVYGVEKALKGSVDSDEYAVYGDDIIVRYASSELLIRMLNRCGFSLNHEKSFVQGPFRESCGADWFNGTSVRPVFLTSSPSTVMELWNDENRLRRILSLRILDGEFEVCKFINRHAPAQFSDCVGPYSDEDFDSYRHIRVPNSRYSNGLWKFKRLIAVQKRLKGTNFLFRKLMHTLRPTEPSNPFQFTTWGGMKVTGAGSRFIITKPNSVMIGYSSSLASYWQDEYTDVTGAGFGQSR